MARVSTSPTPDPAGSRNRRNALLDCRMAMMAASGARPPNEAPGCPSLGSADDSGDDGAVAVAVLAAVAARHVVPARNEVRQQPGCDTPVSMTATVRPQPRTAARSRAGQSRSVARRRPCRCRSRRRRSSCGRARSARSPPAARATSLQAAARRSRWAAIPRVRVVDGEQTRDPGERDDGDETQWPGASAPVMTTASRAPSRRRHRPSRRGEPRRTSAAYSSAAKARTAAANRGASTDAKADGDQHDARPRHLFW